MKTAKEIGEEIRVIRKQKGMSQEQLADLLGLKKSTISFYELGRNNFTVETLCKISEALSCQLDIQFRQ